MRNAGKPFFILIAGFLFLSLAAGEARAQCGFAARISDFKCRTNFDPYAIDTPGYDNGSVDRPPIGGGDTDGGTDYEDALGDATGSCTAVTEQTRQEYLAHLKLREGVRKCVYRDSLGNPTVGVGHLVVPGDNLSVGQCISDERVNQLLEQDSQKAWNAALQQAREAGINDANFIMMLGSVNFQLGTGWRKKFPTTWAKIKAGDYEGAAADLGRTKWAQQTPVRVRDFQGALRELARCSKQQAAP